jgi:hypothetical protein
MTLDNYNIWTATNKVLTRINIYLLQLAVMSPLDIKQMETKKIPIVFNVLLLLVLVFIVSVIFYGAFK